MLVERFSEGCHCVLEFSLYVVLRKRCTESVGSGVS